jgi:DNA-binding HxlR family transcriptional regulator
MYEDKLRILRIISQPYVLDLLNAMEKPKRYKELVLVCKNERTLTLKLKILHKNGLIDVAPIREGNRYFNSYKTTKKGVKVLKMIGELKI